MQRVTVERGGVFGNLSYDPPYQNKSGIRTSAFLRTRGRKEMTGMSESNEFFG